MTTSPLPCPEAEEALGALVLGALDPLERDQVEAHVRVCPSCAAILTELAPLPGLLHRVDLTADELGPPPPQLLERALAAVRAAEDPVGAGDPHDSGTRDPATPVRGTVTPLRRRRWISVVAGAAAAVAVVAVGLGVRTHLSPTEGAGSVVVASASSTTTDVTASISMTPAETGTVLALTLSGVKPGEHCQLEAVSHAGKHEVASSWIASYDGEATVTGTTWMTLADIARLDITTVDGRTLLQVPVPA